MRRKGVAVFGEIVIDFARMQVRRSAQIVPITVLELRLLELFVGNPEYVFSREELIDAVWPKKKRASGRTVDNSILHLRRKLEADPTHPVYFLTVHGAGYRFLPFGGIEVSDVVS